MKTFEPSTLCFFHRRCPGTRAETALRGRYLGPAALTGSLGRSCWWVRFGGRAYLCIPVHLRGVTPDESDRLGIDERRHLDDLLKAAQEAPENYEDLTSQPGPSPPVEFPTEPPREPEEPSHGDFNDGVGTGDQSTPAEGSGETASSTENWRAINFVEGARNESRAEIPDEETAGSPQFKRARLEESLEDEGEQTHDKESRETQFINRKFYSGQASV